MVDDRSIGKEAEHLPPIKVGEKYICPRCKAEVPVKHECPACKLEIDWNKV